jgi:hypothetical protein
VLLASRRTGERSIETALAEIEIITRNVYVQRKERTFSEVRCGSAVFAEFQRLT